ncbi:hypothetical protein [Burkholderia cenocepacia]|uniref:hypothetical protein n=1 Tax=Burkholderia cenocepacia TaxID=95486 RepID=UPI002ABE616B|nr:hypothetical protein [Burkholderia cenocepacia]
MAASEVVLAASQVAATVAPAPVNWVGVVASSAAIGAVVNNAMTLLVRHFDRKREDATLAAQRAPAQLDAALMLEAFARQAVGYFDACEAKIFNFRTRHEPALRDPQDRVTESGPLSFDASLVKDWSVLPIGIVSQCRELPLLLAESAKWTREMANEDWLDYDDACELDGQRAILYGLLASDLAKQIRSAIKVDASDLVTDCSDRLQREFDRLKQAYVGSQGRTDLIPDLRTRLQRECPDVPDPIPPAPTTAPAAGVAA